MLHTIIIYWITNYDIYILVLYGHIINMILHYYLLYNQYINIINNIYIIQV